MIAFEARDANSEGAGGISLHDLVAHALRHNPQRILVGEVRRGEIMPMLEAMNSGQDGSMCTLHANSPAEAFDRILILALRGGLALAERAIHILVGMAVDLIVHVRKRFDGTRTLRYVSEVLEVLPPADTERPAANRLFLPEGPAGRAVAAHTPSPAAAGAAGRGRVRPGPAGPASARWPGREAGDDRAGRAGRGRRSPAGLVLRRPRPGSATRPARGTPPGLVTAAIADRGRAAGGPPLAVLAGAGGVPADPAGRSARWPRRPRSSSCPS